MNKKGPTKKNRVFKRLLTTMLVVLVVGGGIVAALHFRHKPTPPTASGYTKGIPSADVSSSNKAQTSQTSSTGSTPSSSGSSTTSASLLTPTGDFVSDHHPNLSGSPAPNTMTSVCSSTPGASCVISFSNGSVTKSLPTQTLDAGGATYWNWSLQSLGLTAGTWQIVATASLSGQTKTAQDSMNLTVSP